MSSAKKRSSWSTLPRSSLASSASA
jgi:hypothetical protein